MPSKIVNISTLALPLPAPYFGTLQGGQAAIVADGPSAAAAALGAVPNWQRMFQIQAQPSGAALTPHGLPNTDETILGATATVNLNVHSSRFDLVGGVGGCTAAVPNGQYVGQRHWFYQLSATGSAKVGIVPGQMMENRQAVTLQALGAWCALEWQLAGVSGPASGGWKIAELGGPTGSAVALV